MDGSLVLRSPGDSLLEALHGGLTMTAARTGRADETTHQLLKHAVVQLHLGLPAFPQVVVVVLQTLPVAIELLQAVGVDILDAATISPAHTHTHTYTPSHTLTPPGRNLHSRRTPRHLPPLLQTLHLPAPIRLGLALHIVFVERLAPIPDKVRRAHQRRRRRPDLLDLGDVRGHRGGVHQDTLVEAVPVMSAVSPH